MSDTFLIAVLSGGVALSFVVIILLKVSMSFLRDSIREKEDLLKSNQKYIQALIQQVKALENYSNALDEQNKIYERYIDQLKIQIDEQEKLLDIQERIIKADEETLNKIIQRGGIIQSRHWIDTYLQED